MGQLEYAKLDRVSLRDHPVLNENWVQERVAEDPSILGLGDVVLKDRERVQPRSGRLDLLLQDPDSGRRYEVEIQLGRTNESHIIRTIEYWDIERRRYPQYDHTAVIVAEDITSRFLNVIGLFNGFIPLVAVQMSALTLGDQVALHFTTVLDQMTLGLEEDDEDVEITDRGYWERRASAEALATADKVIELIRTFAPDFEPKYNRGYIGFTEHGRANNFVVLRPKKRALRIEPRVTRSDDLEDRLNDAELDVMDYSKRGRYRIRLVPGDVDRHRDLVLELLRRSFDEYGA